MHFVEQRASSICKSARAIRTSYEIRRAPQIANAFEQGILINFSVNPLIGISVSISQLQNKFSQYILDHVKFFTTIFYDAAFS